MGAIDEIGADAPRERHEIDVLLDRKLDTRLLVEAQDEVDAEGAIGQTSHVPDLLAQRGRLRPGGAQAPDAAGGRHRGDQLGRRGRPDRRLHHRHPPGKAAAVAWRHGWHHRESWAAALPVVGSG